jgi:protein subunit release factor A
MSLEDVKAEDLEIDYLELSGIRIIHLPANLVATATENRSQHRNRTLALTRLRKMLKDLEKGT